MGKALGALYNTSAFTLGFPQPRFNVPAFTSCPALLPCIYTVPYTIPLPSYPVPHNAPTLTPCPTQPWFNDLAFSLCPVQDSLCLLFLLSYQSILNNHSLVKQLQGHYEPEAQSTQEFFLACAPRTSSYQDLHLYLLKPHLPQFLKIWDVS